MFQENQQNPNEENAAPEQNTVTETEENLTQETSTQDVDQNTVVPPAPEVPSGERLFSALCYLPFLSILASIFTLYKYPKSKFAELHINQGLGLFVVWFLSVFVAAMPTISLILWLVVLGVSVFGGFMAFTGKSVAFPVVKQIGGMVASFARSFLVGSAAPATPTTVDETNDGKLTESSEEMPEHEPMSEPQHEEVSADQATEEEAVAAQTEVSTETREEAEVSVEPTAEAQPEEKKEEDAPQVTEEAQTVESAPAEQTDSQVSESSEVEHKEGDGQGA